MRKPVLLSSLLAAAVILAGCDDAQPPAAGTPSRSVSPTAPTSSVATASPTPPAVPDKAPKTHGKKRATCENGWTTPPADSPQFTEPLGIVRRTTGVQGPLEVVDMRLFIGPESPPSDKGYLLEIQRWYIKLYATDDLAFQGRFLVESRRFGRGVSAAAPYDTSGYASPDWRGFQFDSADTQPRAVSGLPGTWTGIEYDFVKGGEGLDLPGLPEAVAGCLDGT